MELVTRVDREGHIKYWIKLWNGGLELTDKEQMLFGEILRESPYTSELDISRLISFAQVSDRGTEDDAELLRLMRAAQRLGAGSVLGVATQ